jgi:hypothetical protein
MTPIYVPGLTPGAGDGPTPPGAPGGVAPTGLWHRGPCRTLFRGGRSVRLGGAPWGMVRHPP